MKAQLLAVGSLFLVACGEQPFAPKPPDELRASVGGLSSERMCTYADAQITFNSWSAALTLRRRGIDASRPVDAISRCQYRLFWDGETVTFPAGDVFVGGVNLFFTIDELGLFGATRQMGIAGLDAIEVRVWLVPILGGTPGDPIEQVVLRTPSKNGTLLDGTAIVQQHRGIITSLPPGQYLSVTEFKFPQFFSYPAEEFVSTVNLVITP
jgi:hypothetical protein